MQDTAHDLEKRQVFDIVVKQIIASNQVFDKSILISLIPDRFKVEYDEQCIKILGNIFCKMPSKDILELIKNLDRFLNLPHFKPDGKKALTCLLTDQAPWYLGLQRLLWRVSTVVIEANNEFISFESCRTCKQIACHK